MSSKRGRKGTVRLVKISIFIILVLWSVLQVFPLVWMYYSSVKSNLDIIRYPLRPMGPLHFENYWIAWRGIRKGGIRTGIDLGVYFKNSMIVVFSSLFILTVISALAGYALARYQFRGRRILLLFFIGMVIMPPHVLIIPLYSQIKFLHLVNRYLGLILVYITYSLSFSIVIMWSYFRGFPPELEDAARIDGCSELGLFGRIILPLSKGAIVTILIVNFIGLWNELLLSLTILWQNQVRTLSVGLLGYMGGWCQVEWNLIMSALSIAVMPPIIFYLIFHRNIMRNATLGAIKE